MASNDNGYFRHVRDSTESDAKFMLAGAISLVIVIVIVINLCMYAKLSPNRQARIAQQLTEQPKTGLDPSIIASLPTFRFKQENMENPRQECSVCLSMFNEGDIGRILPNCKHSFHAECIDTWFASDSTCPICRADAQPRAQPQF